VEIPEAVAATAARLASEVNADAILALTENWETCDLIFKRSLGRSMIGRATGIHKRGIKFVVATPDHETYEKLSKHPQAKVIKLAVRAPTRIGQVQHAVCRGIREGILWPGELVVCLVGDGFMGDADTLLVHRITGSESMVAEIIESNPVLAAVVEIAMELGRNGYHGQPVGSAFMIGDSRAVLRRSRQLIPNPFRGHPDIFVSDKKDREIIKRFAYLDGAFIIDDNGHVVTAGRYLDAKVETDIPLGFGTRHRAVAAMTAVTKATGITVSGEDGMVRVFRKGEQVAKIDPKSKMLMEALVE
jgi:DNA integrity scanning protein DisA with diadenylate cyclase activity